MKIQSVVRLYRASLLTIGCSAMALSLACTGGDIGGDPEPTPEGEPEGDADAEDLAAAYDSLLETCDSFARDLGLFEDFDTASLAEGFFEDAENNPNIDLNQENVNACRDYLLSDQACEDLRAGIANGGPCDQILSGTLAAGETCDPDECADGLYCESGQGPECGTCAPVPVEGEACNNFVCDTGLTCEFDANFNPICVVEPGPYAQGDTCENDCGQIFSGLSCVNGICEETQIASEDEPCGDAIGVVCGPFNEVACVAVDGSEEVCVRIAIEGESCADTFQCIDAYCDQTTEVCTAYAGVGEACEPGQCDDEGFCNENQECEAFNETEEQCTE